MSLKRAVSYLLGFSVGILMVFPPINYNIPVVVNSYWWLYGCVIASLFGMYLMSTRLPLPLKTLFVYLFIGCFFSMAPYVSFNALILVVVSLWVFLAFTNSDYTPVFNMVEAAFWLQIIFSVLQLLGRDKLMNFDRVEPVFFGTVFQNMRFGSLLAVAAPLLVIKRRWYIFPIFAACILTKSSGLALALITGVTVYFMFERGRRWYLWPVVAFIFACGYLVWDHASVGVAFTCGRLPVWGDIVRTWVMNTSHKFVLPLTGPIDWKSIFFGRGLDTFLPLFPIFKHDMNPFGQCHNSFLQMLWETGSVGFGILAVYFVCLCRRVRRSAILLAGFSCLAVNAFFTFPVQQVQCWMPILAFIAYAEQVAREAL